MTIKNTIDSQQFSYLRIFSDESCDSVFCFFPEWSCILLSNLCAYFSHIVRISLCVKKFIGPLRGVKSHWWFHHWIGMSSATPRPMCLLWGTTPWPLLVSSSREPPEVTLPSSIPFPSLCHMILGFFFKNSSIFIPSRKPVLCRCAGLSSLEL